MVWSFFLSFTLVWVRALSFHRTRYIRKERGAMPRKPKKPCKHPGCPKLVEGMYCEEHALLHGQEQGDSAVRGYDSKWRKARERFLKCHPLCVQCQREGRLVKAPVVDHIKPHRGNPILFWDERNWQPLCKHHHDVKTMTEDRYQEYKY